MRALCFVVLLGCMPAIALADSDAHGGPLTLKSVLSNHEFWAACLNFTVLLGLLGFAIKKFSNPALAARRDEIQESLEEAQRLKKAAQAKHAEYQSRLDKLDSEIDTLRAEMVKAGESERDRIVADAEEKADRMRREAGFVIDQQLKELRKTLTEETVQASIKSAEALLGSSTSAADQDRLAKSYLDKLGELAGNTKGGQA